MRQWVKSGLWILVWIVLIIIGIFRLDPDFGWHIGMGKYIEKYGVPAKEPFTYTMANFDFIDHEWLTNWLMWKGYEGVGMAGLAVMFGSIALGALRIGAGRGRWSGLAIILGSILVFPRAGVRPQVIDWLFLAILIRWFGDKQKWRKWRWLYPVMVVVWVNLHGGFALGLALLFVMAGVRMMSEKKWDWEEVGVIGLATVASGINPYGFRIWHEVAMQMTDSNLRWTIAEWNPFFVTVEPAFWMMAVLVGMGMWRYKHAFPTWQMVVTAGLGLAGMSSLRHVALFAVAAAGPMTEVLEKMKQEAGTYPQGEVRLRKLYRVLLALGLVLWVWDVGWLGIRLHKGKWDPTKAELVYPVKAVEWLRSNPMPGEVFAPYGWGGYLIWKYPERKVFIDGRGPSWRWDSPDEKYADWAFKDHMKASEGEWGDVFDKFGVKTVVWNKQEESKFLPTVDKWLRKVGWEINKDQVNQNVVKTLLEADWEVVYEDETAMVMRKT